jgi:aryl-alcohol dehydrogenase-like predicted oxidoreductase
MTRHVGDRATSLVGLGGASWSIHDEVDEPGAIATIHAALSAGITLIDTARAYTTVDHPAHNEAVIARALASCGAPVDDVFIVTKGGHFRADHDTWAEDGRPEALRADVERSLLALGRESHDLYLLHKPDASVAIDESVGALAELQREGKIVRLGVSNVSDEQLTQALRIAPISAVENSFSPFRQDDRPLLERCTSLGIAYLAYSPLRSGRGFATDRTIFADSLALADEAGVSAYQLWLGWLLHQAPGLIPIVGANSPRTITDSAGAACIEFDPEWWASVDRELAAASLLVS